MKNELDNKQIQLFIATDYIEYQVVFKAKKRSWNEQLRLSI